MFGKFYCKKCHQIKSRREVKRADGIYYYGNYCKRCYEKVETIDDMLVRLDKELDKRDRVSEISYLKKWIKKEASERYSGSKAEEKAFKAGIYALLDKIGFDYEGDNDKKITLNIF